VEAGMGSNPIGRIAVETSWDGLMAWYKNTIETRICEGSGKWMFRGDKYPANIHPETELIKYKEDRGSLCKTSLEKACDAFGVPADQRPQREKDIIREFQRKLHLHTPHSPARHDIIEWLALMQHHYAPTRLLDWTYSFHVAAYFALAELRCPTNEIEAMDQREVAEIWAIDAKWFCRRTDEILDGKRHDLNRICRLIKRARTTEYMDEEGVRHSAIVHYLIENPMPLVYAVNPFRLNQRLTIQQGVFFLTGDTRESFMNNLCSYIYSDGCGEHIMRVRLLVSLTEKQRIMQEFYKMNVTNAALFPGLDGFARSMKERLAFPLEGILYQPISEYPFLK
jgi:hypothetical protein